MTPRTRTKSRPPDLRNQRRAISLVVGAAALVVTLVMTVAPSLDRRSFVPRLSVDNPTLFDIHLEVAGADRSGWVDLGTVGRESQSVLEEVADPGATWIVRFSYAGAEAGELMVTRDELRDAGWRIAVPPQAGDRLVEQGFAPSSR